ncbi:helix-turn-helix domain-containing protein [Streptomyces sp. AC602_WCS936]|uniref:helix-turn-helix domain-containing protein n=1 Tax=Streptomyces sp. AC602_WCS936 TaxID=2823685 RepID=UPI001C26B4C3|nr:helix-turn-helix transcriptional regulator [Streptomyces sp. AC602_WCS936]
MQSDPPPDWVTHQLRLLGRRICARREALGVSQDELGERTGLGRRRIDQVEKGADDTNLDDLILIGHVLDVPLAELVADD